MIERSLDQRIAGWSPLLVLTDPLDCHRHSACTDLLIGGGAGSVLVFAYHRRPRVVVDRLRESAGETPEVRILSLGDWSQREPVPDLGPGVTVERCGAANLTEVGVAVSETLADHDEGRLCVCLGSVTTLLQYVDVETAFKFMHVTLSRLDGTDGTVHAHLDPDAVDDAAVATFHSLFDTAIERTDDGWTAASGQQDVPPQS